MISKLTVWNLGIGAILCAGAVHFSLAPAAAAQALAAGYHVAEDGARLRGMLESGLIFIKL